MKRELTCIGCPMGCLLRAEVKDGIVQNVEGFSCKVGERYAHEELTAPRRMVTALCRVQGTRAPLPVKTSRPVDKRLVFDCLKAISGYTACAPVHIGDVLIHGVCGTDADVVATAELPAGRERTDA